MTKPAFRQEHVLFKSEGIKVQNFI